MRYQCYVQKVPENVISSMKTFTDDETLQETCLEALAVLVAAGIHTALDSSVTLAHTDLISHQYF